MDKAALVDIDINRGSQILTALDNAGLKIRVALWIFTSEYEDWRLVLSSPNFVDRTLQNRRRVNEALDAANVPAERVPPTLLMRSSNPFIKDLRRIFGKARHIEGMRLGPQMIGDRWVEDAYVYRIT